MQEQGALAAATNGIAARAILAATRKVAFLEDIDMDGKRAEQFALTGPRWARSDWAVRELAISLALGYEITRETSLLREHVFVSVWGAGENIEKMARAIDAGIDEWNSR